MFVAQQTCSDILPVCTLLSQFQNAPGLPHFDAIKHLAKVLRGHPDIPLVFKRFPENKIEPAKKPKKKEGEGSQQKETMEPGVSALSKLHV